MKSAGKLSAAIEVLCDFDRRHVPLKTALADWARGARYAGAKDRAWISGLCLDVLRRRNSLAAAMGDDSPRARALAAMRFLWKTPLEDIAEAAAEEPHGAGALTNEERERLVRDDGPFPSPEIARAISTSPEGEVIEPQDKALPLTRNGFAVSGEGNSASAAHITGDFPEWLTPHMTRVFGERIAEEGRALAVRADIDLRLNTLKTKPDKALTALKPVKANAIPMLTTAARIPAPPASDKAPAITVIPAFNKGWVEVQDLGSQIAAAAAGEIEGAQVLDYCAGGGGKTLALAAMMKNTGQLYAYDRDARRLKPLFDRAKRAGLRNVQIRSPAGDEGLGDLVGKMDVVFVDAPCTGCGAWRRHPDTKWRLTPQQLERRMAEQDDVLREAAHFVKPSGRMVYVTCSFLMEENEDRLAAFVKAHPGFAVTPARNQIAASGLLTDEGSAALEKCAISDGSLRLTPDKIRADGFFIATLSRTG